MTRAEQIVSASNHGEMSFTELLNEADEIGEAYEQDFDNEVTWLEFADGSVAAFLGQSQEIRAYVCRV